MKANLCRKRDQEKNLPEFVLLGFGKLYVLVCVLVRDELEKYIKAGRNGGRGAAVPGSLNLDVF